MQNFGGLDRAAQIIRESRDEFLPEKAPVVSEKDEYQAVRFFAYDEDYACERGNRYYEKVNRVMNIIISFLFLSTFIVGLIFSDTVFTKQITGAISFVLFFYFYFFSWTLFRSKKMKAQYRAFAVNDDKLYMIEYTPRFWCTHGGALSYRTHTGPVIAVDADTVRAAKDKGVAMMNIERALDEKSEYGYLKCDAYKRAKIVELRDIYPVLEMNSRITCQYADAKDKYRRVTILDCYPGLIEYIKSK